MTFPRRMPNQTSFLILAAFVAAACSSSDDPGGGDTCPAPGSCTADGGAGADNDDDQISCPHEGEALVDPSGLPACDSCGGGHCVPESAVPPDMQDQLAACSAGGLCAPDEFIATRNNTIPPSCESLYGSEGRCLSTCLPAVAEQADLLPEADCGAEHRCVPCFDPIDGSETGACGISCDPGPSEPATTAPPCCEGRGVCVPPDAAGDQADSLDADTCEDELLCAPTELMSDDFVAEPCEASGLGGFVGGGPGACMPDCLANMALFSQDGCDAGYACAPCEMPLLGETGACDYLE